MDKLLFGTAGIPHKCSARNTVGGIAAVRELKLDAMELEFVRNVNISKEAAPQVKKAAQENKVILTCHAPYFVNLNSVEKEKVEASRHRILKAARIANLCGAYSVTFHPAFYMGMEKRKTYENVKKNLGEIVEELKSEGNKIWVRPETTGKKSQFGSFDELVQLSSEIEQVLPCIDFAHVHARENGKNNSYAEFAGILEKVEKTLGKTALKNLHCHVAGIEYSEKGERRHLNLKESDLNYKELLKALKEFNCAGVVISESPNIEGDALLMKKEYSKL